MGKYFVCTYGNFEGKEDIVDLSMRKSCYVLHRDARYPSALNSIRQGDHLLLKDGCWIIAYGMATGSVQHREDTKGWDFLVQVDEWRELGHPCHSYGIAWNTLEGGQMSPVKQVEENWAREKLREEQITDVSNGGITDSPVGMGFVVLSELLQQPLSIPSYQTGYRWRMRNVLDLIESVGKWQQEHQELDDAPCYHLGTVILKQVDDRLEIIDGQQRLLTLAIYASVKQKNHDLPLLKEPLGLNNRKKESLSAIIRARNSIASSDVQLDFDKICLSVVMIGRNQPEDLAYTFFNTSNTTGKRLSDYDLLKTYHLRYIGNEIMAERMVKRWHALTASEKQDELLHKTLFRLRHWREGTAFRLNAAETPERDVFHHFAYDLEMLDGFENVSRHGFRFDSFLSAGLEFFEYADHYRKKYEEFCSFPVIRELCKALCWQSNGVIHAGIHAIAFLFFCKFGDIYLADAVYALSYRLSALRNASQVRGSYLNDFLFRSCTSALDRATCEGEYISWLMDKRNPYQVENHGNTANCYWYALRRFLESLEEKKLLSIPQCYYRSSLYGQE